MNKTVTGILGAATILFGTVLLPPTASAQATQTDFDEAIACCWTGSPASACTTPGRCATSYDSCEARPFYYLDLAYNKRYYSGNYVGTLSCTTMVGRGENDDAIQLFVPPAPQKTEDGEVLEVSPPVATSLLAATKVMQLQSRGASREELEAAVGDDVELSIEDADEGGRVITVRGDGADDIVLRYDADGNTVKEAPEFTVGDDIRAAMAEAAEGPGKMSARGSWCAEFWPTGGCARANAANASAIPGAAGTGYVGSYSVPSSFNVLAGAGFPASNWTIPNSYNALSLVEYFNLGFIRTQAELDQFMAFCWLPNSNVAGSGSCQTNLYGVCPYDANAGVTCQSMAGMQ